MRDFSIPTDTDDFQWALDVLSYWRFTHEEPLTRAMELLENSATNHDKHAIFAKRLKRAISILRKLFRYQTMSLKKMQDIGGCRAVFTSEKKLRKTIRDLKKRPEFRLEDGGYRSKDYIKHPKADGYRSYHLVGKFPGADGTPRNIELQLRTQIQHFWATALEIVDLFTGQALKSNQGDPEWRMFFAEVGQQFSIMDNIHLFETLEDSSKYGRYSEVVNKRPELVSSCLRAAEFSEHLKVVRNLEAYAASIQIVQKQQEEISDADFVLIQIDTVNTKVMYQFFSSDDKKSAEEQYLEAEREVVKRDDLVVALVSSSVVGGIREAYPNYFGDSTEFLKHLVIILDAARALKTTGNPPQKTPSLF